MGRFMQHDKQKRMDARPNPNWPMLVFPREIYIHW
jgi:hypothetical protein